MLSCEAAAQQFLFSSHSQARSEQGASEAVPSPPAAFEPGIRRKLQAKKKLLKTDYYFLATSTTNHPPIFFPSPGLRPLQPFINSRGQFFLRSGTNKYPYMSAGEFVQGFILAAYKIV